MELYVKNTGNCGGMSLQTFDLLGPAWQGDSLCIPFVDPGETDDDGEDETLVDCEVTGWTDLFMGRPCPVHVAWAAPTPPTHGRGGSGRGLAGLLSGYRHPRVGR